MLVRRLRLYTGLILAAFVISHFINHSLGLLSLEAMESYRRVNALIWQSTLGGVALYGALIIHGCLALYALFRRTTLRMPWWEALQLTFGLLIPPLIAIHVIGTRVSPWLLGFDVDYPWILYVQWSNARPLVQQPLLVLVVWIHLLVGLHYWLRLKSWYPRALPLLYALAVLLPVLALLGFARAGTEVLELATDPAMKSAITAGWNDASRAQRQFVLGLEPKALWTMAVLLALVLAAREVRRQLRRRRKLFYALVHPTAGSISARADQSILEALRDAGIRHASVCGGRARCTTCRVRVGAGLEYLSAPAEMEAAALQRIGASENVRLACQTRPSRDLHITPLLPANASAADAQRPGGVGGHEQPVAVMFVDLRASTKLGEERLPYDVVFILNQFFAEMSEALHETGGHYAQFSGDGLMALYGLESDVARGCRDAMHGAAAMVRRLALLNQRLAEELPEPLQIGIGIHCGEAIVGTMGPPSSPNLSAIGDNINIAARLEALCKTYQVTLVVSEETAQHAGVDLSAFDKHAAPVRGREEAVVVYAVPDPLTIRELNTGGPRRNGHSAVAIV
ncbi:MAG: adenylate/guanylate cyclase domain-containing protein [Gammaproteobacteria bacterium]|nr:adenylate/guanylate cyclase domain-containing protein [Gammaproteobacteria bacterium]MDX2460056.1 adenylate/guanylate cyclase domain-containing protein [Gammaproteobacteria bacterium]